MAAALRESSKAAGLRRKIGHPVIDADGHLIETAPIFKGFLRDYVRDIGGGDLAAADLDQALMLDAGYAPAHFHRGMVLLRKGREADAAASFRTALSHQADYPQALYYLGEALNLIGEFDSAIATLEQAIESDATDPRTYRLLGRVLDRCSRPEEAMILYQKAREVAPS